MGSTGPLQPIDDVASAGSLVSPAHPEEGGQHIRDLAHLLHPRPDAPEARLDERLNLLAGGCRSLREVQKDRDVLQREADGLGRTEKAEAFQRARTVEAVVSLGAALRPEQVAPFVVPHGGGGDAPRAGELTDREAGSRALHATGRPSAPRPGWSPSRGDRSRSGRRTSIVPRRPR